MPVVTATVTGPTGGPREGLAVSFAAPAGHADVIALTDASGVFRAEIAPDTTYRVPVENAVIVDGRPFPAGTVFVVRVADTDADVAGIDAIIDIIDASRPALLDRAGATERVMVDLLDRIDAAGIGIDLTDLLGRVRGQVAGGGRAAGGSLADLLDEGA